MSEQERGLTWETEAQGWDIPDSMRGRRQAEPASNSPNVPRQQMRPERAGETTGRSPSPVSELPDFSMGRVQARLLAGSRRNGLLRGRIAVGSADHVDDGRVVHYAVICAAQLGNGNLSANPFYG